MPLRLGLIADTEWEGERITTFHGQWPRASTHAQFMTYRHFSRNAESQRAVPVKKVTESVLADPIYPLRFSKNEKGMVGYQELDSRGQDTCCELIDMHRAISVDIANALAAEGLHKEYANRMTTSHAYINVLFTATSRTRMQVGGGFEYHRPFDAFIKERATPEAQGEINWVANQVKEILETRVPEQSRHHLPFITQADKDAVGHVRDLMLISAGRCARVSYTAPDRQVPDVDRDLELAHRLWESRHMSPFEHAAIAATGQQWYNFYGWKSFRSTL